MTSVIVFEFIKTTTHCKTFELFGENLHRRLVIIFVVFTFRCIFIVIICIVMVPVGIFLAYLWFEKSREDLLKKDKKRPRSAKAAQSTSSKPYERVNTRDEYIPPLAKMPNAQIKFEL